VSAQLGITFPLVIAGSEPVRNHSEPIESSSEKDQSSSETSEKLNDLAVPNHQSNSSIVTRFRTTSPKGERKARTTHSTGSFRGEEIGSASASPPPSLPSRGLEPAGPGASPVLGIQNRFGTTPETSLRAAGDQRAEVRLGDGHGLSPRPYQVASIEAVETQFREGVKSTLVVLPTGTGKTIVLAILLLRFKLAQEGRRARGLVVAHRTELIAQNAAKCRAAGLTTSIEQGSSRATRTSDVVVASVQTLQRSRLLAYAADEFDFIVFDEAHHAEAKGYQNIHEHFPGALLLGLTASPMRLDGKPLGNTFQTTAFTYDLRQAITDEWLVPIVARRVRITDVDMSAVKAAHGDLAKDELGAVLRDAKALQGVVGPLLQLAGTRRTLVFAVDVAHAHALAELLNKHKPGSALALDGNTPEAKRRAVLELFRDGAIQYLVNCELLTEGFDDPGIECVALARPTMSVALLIQMVGRGTRLLGLTYAESCANGKRDVLLLDFVGNLRHRLATPADALAGVKLPDDLAAEVAKELDSGKELNVSLTLAAAEERTAEETRRKAELALAHFRTKEVDPFVGDYMPPLDPNSPAGRAPATEAQMRLLKDKGYSDPPAGITKAEASAMIDAADARARAGLCSLKQCRLFEGLGLNTKTMTAKRAGELFAKCRDRGFKKFTVLFEPEFRRGKS